MAHKKRYQAQLAFDALSVEGGLLSPEWLGRVAQLQAGQQTEADYRIEKGLNVRDEIGRFWRIGQAYWQEFNAGIAAKADPSTLGAQFVTQLLDRAFGFRSLKTVEPVSVGGKLYPIGHSALGPRCPVVIAPADGGIDTPLAQFSDESRKRSAFGLAQEYLNADEEALWGIATDGVTLRILRDNSSLTRPAWVEADLRAIFTEERYADFAALWLLLHESRFGSADRPPNECVLEMWRNAGREEGTRAREHLRRGVEDALQALGQGFLGHPDNTKLRQALQEGALTKEAYFQQLLRLVYRLIFLLTAEERGLLHPSSSKDESKQLYAQGYGLRRMRDRCVKRNAHDRFGDQWESLKIVFQGLVKGQPVLALPALGGLFAADQCPDLQAAKVENRALLLAVFRLSWLREPSGLVRVNWRDMGPEELGSVYESLLELVPQVTQGARAFGFASGGETKGNQRKLTGSYYTPDSLVQMLLDSALEPVVQATLAAKPKDPVEALLSLTVIDPACGSGHFLLAAARRLAVHVARQQVQGTPSAKDYRKALRQVVGRCVFGVDRNPMALELARMALWLEAMTPDAPLTFVDHHLVCGDALLGLMDLDVMKGGIPGEAFKALAGDSKETVKVLAKRNRDALKHAEQNTSSFDFFDAGVAKQLEQLDALPDDNPEQVDAKRVALQAVLVEAGDTVTHPVALAADLFVSAFLTPKNSNTEKLCPTTADLLNALHGISVRPETVAFARQEMERQRVLHWKLKFAQVFARGGFDVVLGNPPWERIKLQEQEFFASRDEGIATAPNSAARKRLIVQLPTTNPVLWAAWCIAGQEAEGQSSFMRASGRYPLTGAGDVNTYALFAETALSCLSPMGRAGLVLPSGIATDDSTKAFFAHIAAGRLTHLYDFQTGGGYFNAIGHARFKFVLMTLLGAPATLPMRMGFFFRNESDFRDPRRHMVMSAEDINRINPNTRTCPIFRTERDAELTKRICSRAPILVDDNDPNGNPWGIQFSRLFDMANDSDLFHTVGALPSMKHPVPLYEAKMIHQFDHRWSTYTGTTEDGARDVTEAEKADPKFAVNPRYWVDRAEVESRLADKGWPHKWLMGWRDIARSTDERTTIAAVLPRFAVGHVLPLMFPGSLHSARRVACLLAVSNSLALDFVARQKVGGTHLTYGYFKQFPVLPPSAFEEVEEFIVSRVGALVCGTVEMEPFGQAIGVAARAPTTGERRALLRAELDALIAALYGLSRDELRYVLDPTDVMGEDYPSETFRVLKEKELRLHGEYRTRRLVLEAWDRLEKSGELPDPVEPQA